MRISLSFYRPLLITGVVLALIGSLLCFTPVAYAQNDDFKLVRSPEVSLLDRIVNQVERVFAFGAQAIQAVMDINSITVPTPIPDTVYVQSENGDASPVFLPDLRNAQTGSLMVNVPFIASETFLVSGQSNLSDATVQGVLSVLGRTELASVRVQGEALLQSLRVSGRTQLGELTADGTSLGSLRVSGISDMAGLLSARGGIDTDGADVNLQGGRLFASNVVNSITAGSANVTISGTADAPIISVRREGQSTPNLEKVRAKGGCAECLTDSDIVPALTIQGGVIDGTAIGLSSASEAVFTNVTIGSTTATSTLSVFGFAEFDGGLNVTSGCVAVNSVCLGGGVAELDDLSDVTLASTTLGEILLFDGSEWVNVATSSLGFAFGATNLDELTDVVVTGTSLGNVLVFNGTQWVNVATSTLGFRNTDVLSDLSDVTLASTTLGEILLFDGMQWVNVATSSLGLGDGTYLGLRDTPSSYTPDAVSFVNSAGDAMTQSANFVFTGSQLGIGTSTPIDTLSVAGNSGILDGQSLRFYNGSNSAYAAFRASSSLTSSVTWALPISDGDADEILVTDGAGNLRFENVSAVGGGSETFIGLDDVPAAFVNKAIPYVATNTLAFSSNFVFDGTRLGVGTNVPTATLTVEGGLRVGSNASTPALVYNSLLNTVGMGTANPAERFTLEGGSMLQRGAAPGSTYAPAQTGSLNLPDNGNDIAIVGPYAFIAMRSGGSEFRVVNISDPAAPSAVSSLDLPASANAVAVSGKYAYAVTDVSSSEFRVINISDPFAATNAGFADLSSTAFDVAVQGRYAYVVTDGTGADLHVIDISDPMSPREVGSLELSGGANGIKVQGEYAYIAMNTSAHEFRVINISNPTAPSITASLDLGAAANEVFVQGNFAYLALSSEANEFNIVNISSPSAPAFVSSVNLSATAHDVFVSGQYAYVSTAGTLEDVHVINIASPSSPSEVGAVELASGAALGITVVGSYAYVVTSSVGDDVHVIDISGIDVQSAFVHSFQSGTLNTLGDVAIAGNAVVGKSLHSGIGGIQTDGSLYVQGSASSYYAGSLGIGTTTPARSLSVVGSASLTGGFYDTSNSAGLKGYLLQSTGTSTRWRATSTLGFATAFTDSSGLRVLLSDETGTGNAVFSDSPTFTGTLLGDASSFAGLLTLTGSSANISLGSNYLSGDGDDEGVYVTSAGFVGIGTTTPNQEFSVAGTIASTDLLGGATSLSTDAQGNIIRTPSDGTLKTDVTTIEGALDTLLQLRGVSYRWLDTERFGEQTEIGFIAQEVDLLLPEVVRKGGEYWSLNTSNMVAVVVEAVKELWQQVQGNTAEIELLRERVEVLETELRISSDTVEEESDTEVIEIPEPTETEEVPETETDTELGEQEVQKEEVITQIEDEILSTEDVIVEPVPISAGL